jgi:hypothetical protein
MTIRSPLKIFLGPYLSMREPTTILAGMVRATLHMASILMCSDVIQSSLFSMVEARGAMLNQRKKVIKKAIQVKCNIRILSWSKSNNSGFFIFLN